MPPKGYKKPTKEKQLEIRERREYVIRKALAQGMYTTEIVDMCRKNKHFKKQPSYSEKGGPGNNGDSYLSRSNIIKWIQDVKKKLRINKYTADDEITDAYERLLFAFRTAVKRVDPKGMILAQKEINRMLGLRRPSQGGMPSASEILDEMEEMINSVPEAEEIE